jgi:hypothetical protein
MYFTVLVPIIFAEKPLIARREAKFGKRVLILEAFIDVKVTMLLVSLGPL